ncbi:hypothetical protein MMC28_011745 [Mycoblastus sanguinarius]|nr:hypothetical protein [Mycoblastus sanguinarius]
MDAPWNYDEDGAPVDEETKILWKDREEYVESVRQVERSKGLPGVLSSVLADETAQDLATALRLYNNDGKFGFYTKILEAHHERWGQESKELALETQTQTEVTEDEPGVLGRDS